MAGSGMRGLQLSLANMIQEGKDERFERIRAKGKVAAAGKVRMLRLLERTAFLLELHVRIHDLFGLHGRKFMGNDL